MSIGALAGNLAAETANRVQTNQFAELSSEEFVRIMVTELTSQDPFEPNDSAAILEQLSSLRNIEGQLSLEGKLEELVLQNQITQASSMIGKSVQGLTETNDSVEGLVQSVRVIDGEAVLELDTGRTLPISRVLEVAAGPSGNTAALGAAG